MICDSGGGGGDELNDDDFRDDDGNLSIIKTYKLHWHKVF